ncbi:hypothetical protein L3073_07645 [Ancylomarina sp. DW003]|nr:hypothetical protein [Ancylomarina sp. DW003]MDE5422080.1 hypothetical protein [Ancylomarina sp. DW003]
MEIIKLARRSNIEENKKLVSQYDFLEKLFEELRQKELPLDLIGSINQKVELLNVFSGLDKDLSKLMSRNKAEILQLLEKDLKIVCKGHYQNLWLSVGLAAFGLPMGVLFGISSGSMAYIGLGLPLGMLIGMTYGIFLDKKAQEDGKQLETETTLHF